MSLDTLSLHLAGRLVTRRHRRNYEGKRRTPRNQPHTYLLSPAAVQLVTGTPNAVHPTGQFTTNPAVNGVNEGSAR